MLRTQIRFTEEQFLALRSLAEERRISVAELIRQAVDHVLRGSPTPSRAEMNRRALAAAGRFRSGVKDISIRHDVYLADIEGD